MIFTDIFSSPIGTILLESDDNALLRLELPNLKKTSDPGKILQCPTPFLSRVRAQILAWFDGKLREFDFAIAPCGTIFQQAVWREIRTINYGQTRSYGDIAKKLGNRNLARAVGGAAHVNPIPLIIPCHRVVGAHGELRGFAGGLDLKQMLLEREHKYNT